MKTSLSNTLTSGGVFQFAATLIILSSFLLPTIAKGQEKSNYPFAIPLIQSAKTMKLSQLEKSHIRIGFKNMSGAQWRTDAGPVISLRSSVKRQDYFYDASWKSGNVIMTLPGNVKKGEIAYFSFDIEAPKRDGVYVEEFFLAQGDVMIVESKTTVTITVAGPLVKKPSQAPAVSATPVDARIIPAVQLTATTLITSAKELTMKQYERVSFGIGFKNTSGMTWKKNDSQPITLRSSAKKEDYFYDSSWVGGNTVMTLSRDVNDGELIYFWFTLFAPIYPGSYTEKFALYQGESKVVGSDVLLPITVTTATAVLTATEKQSQQMGVTLIETVPPVGDPPAAPNSAPDSVQPTPQGRAQRAGIIEDRTEQEPSIRVGLYHTREPVQMTANKEYEVRDNDGLLIAKESAGVITTVVFDFATKQYIVTTPTVTTSTPKYIRFAGTQMPYRIVTRPDGTVSVEPLADQDTLFEILSYTNRPAWSSTLNDNVFRGEMEIRYASATDRLWVVNELKFENYLKGIAETSNSSPYEYQKALIIAARTYAKYHIDRNSKNAADGFTVKPTEADQVYRGYGAEKRLPNVARAVQETSGVVVYYGDTLAITPYSSNTDGRTRSWEEVWGGGPKPWLVSVPDPCCTGMAMRYSSTSYSHGVGMSARGALAMALDNKSFEEILKYYYTGIELRRKY